jgi:hypothetical protein
MNHGKYALEDKHGVATASSPAGFRTVPVRGKEGF